MTPYTTKSGVQIGIRYQPPRPGMYRDDELVQAAMLGIKRPRVPKLVFVAMAVVGFYLLLGSMKLI